MRNGLRALPLLAMVVLVAGCGSGGKGSGTTTNSTAADTATVAANDARAQQVVDAVHAVQARYDSNAILYGAWVGDKPLAVGAVGNALPGVRAAPDQHVRVGVGAEWFLGTLLLRMADQGRVRVDDAVARWYPRLPNADKVTLQMLANNTSGYNDFVTTPAFSDAFARNPFRSWKPSTLIAIAMSKPPLFAPGTSWAFSDTNATILGQILQRVGGKSLGDLYQENLFSKLGMTQTRANTNSIMPAPALHGYETSRGPYEDSTNWDADWVPGASNVTSTIGDLGRWARTYGSVLTSGSRKLQVAPLTAGKGPLPQGTWFGYGLSVTNGWVATNPQLMGYNGIVAYLPSQKLTFVTFTTLGPKTPAAVAAGTAVFQGVAHALTPQNIPAFSVLPRGQSGNQ
jgi:D-alanyl-D-alanine carboxypeptidase